MCLTDEKVEEEEGEEGSAVGVVPDSMAEMISITVVSVCACVCV